MKLRALFGGRLGVFLTTHGERLTAYFLIALLCVIVMVQHTLAYQDEVAREQDLRRGAEQDRDAAEKALAEDRALRGLPNPAIVLDAKNARALGLRLSEIAGGVDGERVWLMEQEQQGVRK